jgi:hypothetical protein
MGCMAGEICCATGLTTTVCQSNTMVCPNTALGTPSQLCATAAECFTKTDVCSMLVIPGVTIPPVTICQPGDGGTATVDGGDAAPGTDAAPDAPVDAPTGG